MKKTLLLFLVWFILLHAVNKGSFYLVPDKTSYELPKKYVINPRFWIAPWLNFDGRNYLKVATEGYSSAQQRFNLRVFFPFYPLLVRIASLNLLLNPIFIGLAISIISLLGSLFILHKLLKLENIPETKRFRTIFLLFLFPASFFYLAFYTESLLLLLSVLTFYFIKKKNFLAASVSTTMATATKILGIVLIPALIWEVYKQYKQTKKIPFSVILAPLGIILYLLYTFWQRGDLTLAILGHSDWGRKVSILSPIFAFKEGLIKVLFGSVVSRNNFFAYSVEVLEFFSALFFLLVVVFGIKKLKFSYWLFVSSSFLLVVFSGALGSINRVMLVVFPLHIFLVKVLPTKIYYLVCLCLFILLLYLTSLFLRGYFVA
jgi:Gpi18-like mannosyltransferase